MANEARRLIRLGEATPGDAFRAMVELGLARLRSNSSQTQRLIAAQPGPVAEPDRNQAALVSLVAYVIPRVAARLPWRADCLIQALAARRWLARHGVATTLTLGVQRDQPADFEAHAWLMAGTRIVTGGDISGYEPFARP